MATKKKEKATGGKKSAEKTKGESFLDNLRPISGMEKAQTTGGTGHTKATNQTKIENTTTSGKTKKIAAGGVVAAAMGALLLAGMNFSSFSENSQEEPISDTPAVVNTIPASEAAATNMMPEPLAPQKARLAEPQAPQKARLAEPTKKITELAKPSKPDTKKSGKLVNKGKSKDTVKKSVASGKKQKVTKKSKKTLAAKSMD